VPYRVDFTALADKQLEKLDPQVQRRVGIAVDKLADNPRPPGIKSLVGRSGYRLRVGDYRVIYRVEDSVLVVLVVELGHRREIYR
jgi:mRNA interferase RelE/StbE